MTSPLTNHREAGEGRDREQERRLEDRTRWFQEGVMCCDGVSSRWDNIELKKGTLQTPDQQAETVAGKSKDIDSKWEDFERLSFGEVKSLHRDTSSAQDREVRLTLTITHSENLCKHNDLIPIHPLQTLHSELSYSHTRLPSISFHDWVIHAS